jgi:predicted nucleic acid-binding protein
LAGVRIVIPTIIDYEVRREAVRVNASVKLRNLDLLGLRFGWLDVSAQAFRRAAEFWAMIRNLGLPTATTLDLDADCILAAVADTAFDPADTVTVATTNVAHLGRFPGIDAQDWTAIR